MDETDRMNQLEKALEFIKVFTDQEVIRIVATVALGKSASEATNDHD